MIREWSHIAMNVVTRLRTINNLIQRENFKIITRDSEGARNVLGFSCAKTMQIGLVKRMTEIRGSPSDMPPNVRFSALLLSYAHGLARSNE